MATFNFGQQINQSLESAFNRIERAAERAQQVQQLMEEREIAQQVRLAQQQFREQQLSLQQQQLNMQRAAQQATREFREEQLGLDRRNLASQEQARQSLSTFRTGQQEIDRSRTEKLNQLTDEQIKRLQEQTSSEGSDFSDKRLIELIKAAENTLERLSEEELAQEGMRREALGETENVFGFGADPNDPSVVRADSALSATRSRIQRLNQLMDVANEQLRQNLIENPDRPETGADTQTQDTTLSDADIQEFADQNGLSFEQAQELLTTEINN